MGDPISEHLRGCKDCRRGLRRTILAVLAVEGRPLARGSIRAHGGGRLAWVPQPIYRAELARLVRAGVVIRDTSQLPPRYSRARRAESGRILSIVSIPPKGEDRNQGEKGVHHDA